MSYVSMKQMLETGVHFGHQTRRWNPKMRPYIFGARNGIHIIDLQQTVGLFRTAHDFIADAVAKGGGVLFVGTKRQAQETVRQEAERAEMFHITSRWMGGTLTNFQTIKNSIDRLTQLQEMFADETIKRYSKKERSKYAREMGKLEESLGGIQKMEKLPAVAFIVDPKREDIAVKECRKLRIPIVAVVDTNCDPDIIDHVIPGNDDAIRAIKLFVTAIADACLEGKARRGEEEAMSKQDAKAAAEAPVKPVKPVEEEKAKEIAEKAPELAPEASAETVAEPAGETEKAAE